VISGADERARRALAALDVDGASPSGGLRPRGRGGSAPLSFAQRRLWFLEQLDPGLPLHNVARAMRMRGPLDEEALARAIGAIVERHESLRTTIRADSGEPRQYVAAAGSTDLEIDPLEGVPSERREGTARSRMAAEAARPFDLERGPLVRAKLYRISATDRIFLWTMHHAISDVASLSVFVRELAAFYRAFVRGERPDLPALPIQYADWAEWQQEKASGQAAAALGQAVERLAGAPPILEIPSDRPRGARQTFAGGRLRGAIPSEIAAAVRELARSRGATPFMVLVAAFDALLSRWTGSDDVVLGMPISGRSRIEVENLIGFFVNTAVLRTDLSGDPTVAELLARVRGEALDVFDRQQVPFEMLVETLRPERLLTHSPVFQVMFNFHGEADPPPDLPGVEVTAEPVDNGTSPFDLSLIVAESPEGFATTWNYNRDLFDAATMGRMADHYRALVEAFARNPDARLSEIEILPPAEREALERWSAGPDPGVETAATVADLFAERVRADPEGVAVESRGERMTAGELDRASSAIAVALRASGSGRGGIVAVAVDRTVSLPAALLGVVKSGAAFLPLDPSHPEARIRDLLEDAGASVVLADRAHAEDPVFAALPVVVVEDVRDSSGSGDLVRPDPTDAAYVIYTSGTTGRPKGVVVEHRSLVNLVRSMIARPGVSRDDVWAAVTPASFDIAIAELFVPLASGARVVVVPREESVDPGRLARRLEASAATILQATPATWQMLVADGWKGKSDLRALSGGEALSAELALALLDRGREMWNLYGPTETTIWSAAGRVTDPGAGAPPIGEPAARTTLHVVDRRLRLAPIGVPGELAIGGEGVAREYLGRPEETAERFVPNPYGAGRLYRTGDRVRRRADGALEFLGRLDDQLKIRGVRVEPAEVERALEEDPDVRRAVVVAAGDPPERRLAAFVMVRGSFDRSAIRERLRRRLPEAMVPTEIERIETFPLTSSGKVDRRALAERSRASSGSGDSPRNPTEELVARTWREVLRVERIGVDQNFFDLGGHSLLATRILARLRAAFDVDLPLRILFERPTVAGLAGEISRRASAGVPA